MVSAPVLNADLTNDYRDTTNFFVAYISLILFAVLYVGHKLITRCPIVPLHEIDLTTGARDFDDEVNEKSTPQKRSLMSKLKGFV